jgi:hypothetical protein
MPVPKSLPRTPKRIGIGADHGGSESKQYLAGMLRARLTMKWSTLATASRSRMNDYPDFVAPLARAVAYERSGSRRSHVRQWRGGVHSRQQGPGRAGPLVR